MCHMKIDERQKRGKYDDLFMVNGFLFGWSNDVVFAYVVRELLLDNDVIMLLVLQ